MRSSKITITDEQLLKRYSKLNSCAKLAQELNVSKSLITVKLRKLGADLAKNRCFRKDFLISDEEIKERYIAGESLNDIAKDAQKTKGLMALRNRLKELGVDTTKNMKRYSEKISKTGKHYLLNETIFQDIDTEEKAYWLGFLMADGYNHENKNCVALRLQERDKEVLEKFKTFLQTDAPILTCNRITPVSKKNVKYCELTICSPTFSKILGQQGCIQRKTYILKYPEISSHLQHHFIRGYFDGDGCISVVKRKDRKNPQSKSVILNIVGKEDVMLKMQEIICENTGVTKTKLRYNPNNFAKTISWGGRLVCKRILDFLYKDATVFMQRKYEKYLQLW